jgi:peptidoglycan hydrolase CwlO-like protein
MKIYRITSMVLMIVCTALLIHSNHQKNETAKIVDQYFDLQTEYTKIFDDVQELEEYSDRLETQVDLLTSFISNAEYEIDTVTSDKPLNK